MKKKKFHTANDVKEAVSEGRIKQPYCLHIPKTGGSYAKNLLYRSGFVPDLNRKNVLWERTYFAKSLEPLEEEGFQPKSISPEELENYFVFAVVRNPFDLLVSHYHYGDENNPDLGWSRVRQRHNLNSFEDYIRLITDKNANFFCPPMQRFLFFPIYDDNGKIQVDAVLFSERLDDGLQKIYSWFGRNMPNLPDQHKRINKHRERDYKHYYTLETRTLVENAFQKELNIFGYSFEGRMLHTTDVWFPDESANLDRKTILGE